MSNVAAKIHRGVFGTYVLLFDASCIPHKIQEPKRSFICGDGLGTTCVLHWVRRCLFLGMECYTRSIGVYWSRHRQYRLALHWSPPASFDTRRPTLLVSESLLLQARKRAGQGYYLVRTSPMQHRNLRLNYTVGTCVWRWQVTRWVLDFVNGSRVLETLKSLVNKVVL